MTTRCWVLAAAAVAALTVCGCGRQGDETPGDSRDARQGPYYDFNPADRDFVRTVAEADLAEIEASRLALSRASRPEVKADAQHLLLDHRKIQADLAELAQKKGVTLPTATDDEHKKTLEHLADLSGAEFDRAYAAAMGSDHTQAVSLFEEHPKKGRDGDVRAFAEKTVPTLRMHLKMVRDLSSKLTGSSSPN
jgi:putative membrane protein